MATRTKKADKKEAVAAVAAAIEAVRADEAAAQEHATATPIETPQGVLALARSSAYRATLVATASASGNKSFDNGDAVALLLRGADLDTVYKIGAKELGVEEKELRTKYAHLNAGQQRMNIGNRVRAAIRKREAQQSK